MDDKFLNIFAQIPMYVFWKDRDLVFRGGNFPFAQIAGLNSEQEINGKTDFDFPWTKEQADLYRATDLSVLDKLQTIERIEPQLQASGKLVQVYVRKAPLFDQDNKLIGVIGSYIETGLSTEKICLPKRQHECLGYLIDGFTAKQIAKKMALSVRTVEHYVNILKVKFVCRNKSQLISKVMQLMKFNAIEVL